MRKLLFWFLGGMFLLVLVRLLSCEIFMIPSNSMEFSIQTGDRILVSKLSYGARLPTSPLEIPILNIPSFLIMNENQRKEAIEDGWWEYHRVPGFSEVRRGDIIVFNLPLYEQMSIVKRCIGLPREIVQVVDYEVFVDDVNIDETGYVLRPPAFNFGFDSVKQFNVYPYHDSFKWTRINYGPVTVPASGMQIPLNEKTYFLYKKVFNDMEHAGIEMVNGKFIQEGKHVTSYTFQHDYYFMMGDNRGFSDDSRIWGFVPEQNIIGKAVRVLYSTNASGFNWSRILKPL